MRAGHNLKAAVKRAVKQSAASLGAFRLSRPPASRILTYHSVGLRLHDMNVRPEDFAAQMEWLAAHTRVISLAEAAAGNPGVAITFDDGYLDNLQNAAPVLCRLRLPATVFMIAGKAGSTLSPCDVSETTRLMTWQELRQLADMGIEIGAHTLTHRRLSTLTPEQQKEEIFGSKAILEDRLQREIRAFAYPYGAALDYDAYSKRLAYEAGFHFAVSNRYGPNRSDADRWALRRIWIDGSDTLHFFQAKVTGTLDVLALLDSPVGIRCRRWLNRALRIG